MLFLIILILTFTAGFVLTWWATAVIAFVAAFFVAVKSGQAFWSGFSGTALAWLILALLKSIPNNNLLAAKVATMVKLPNWILLLALTAVIGGLVSGLSSLSGFLVKKAFSKTS